MVIFLIGNLVVSIAENGAVITPPSNNPKIIFQCCVPSVSIKVMALVVVSKNFRKVELPTTYLGVLPSFIKEPVTNGPQPPPAKESKNPPKSPKIGILDFFLVIFSGILFFPLRVFAKIFTPIKSV